MSWNPGAERELLSFLLLGIVDCHVVIENHKQEKRHAQHVGEDGELHVRDHPVWGGAVVERVRKSLFPASKDTPEQRPSPSLCVDRHCSSTLLSGHLNSLKPSALIWTDGHSMGSSSQVKGTGTLASTTNLQ